MDPITTQQIRDWSQVADADWAAAGYPVATPDGLALPLAQAVAYVQKVTGLRLATIVPDTDEATLFAQAVRMRVEQLVYTQVQSAIASATADTYITSFSVPGYSESRAVRPSASASSTKRPLVNPWPLLDEILWLLMTPEMVDYWVGVLTGVNAPAFSFTEVDWSGSMLVDEKGDYVGMDPTAWPGWGAL